MTDSLAQSLVDAAAIAEADSVHVVCECNEDVALCGVDLTGVGFTDDEVDCPLCALVDEDSCPRCGE